MDKRSTPSEHRAYQMSINILHLNEFIKREEKSKWNPMYYLYYPAKASVIASKEQLIAIKLIEV